MLRTYVYERTYVLLKYDARLKYPLCYDPLDTHGISYIYILNQRNHPLKIKKTDRLPPIHPL